MLYFGKEKCVLKRFIVDAAAFGPSEWIGEVAWRTRPGILKRFSNPRLQHLPAARRSF